MSPTVLVAGFLILLSLLGCVPSNQSQVGASIIEGNGLLKVAGDLHAPITASVSLLNLQNFAIELTLTSTVDWITLGSGADIIVGAASTMKVSVEMTCLAPNRVQHGWLTVSDGASEWAVPARLVCPAPTDNVGNTQGVKPSGTRHYDAPLSLEPPLLVDANVVRLDPLHGPFNLRLDIAKDYLILFPRAPMRRGLIVSGGRNVVIVGGEVEIPWRGDNPTIAERRAFFFRDQAGTLHLEGIKLHGEDLTEGIQLNTPNADVQIANVAVIDVHARDQDSFTDNHPDLIQSFGGAHSITIERFTGSTDYQGLFFHSATDGATKHGPIAIHDTNIIGLPTARYLLWFSLDGHEDTVSLKNVWLEVPSQRSGGIGRAVWPDVNGDFPHRAESINYAGTSAIIWPEEMTPQILGHVTQGSPPAGNFVNADFVGTNYISPGYVLNIE